MRLPINFLTWEERTARWRERLQWHPWFAWRPVCVTHVGIVWLERIERRMQSGYNGSYYEYRTRPVSREVSGS